LVGDGSLPLPPFLFSCVLRKENKKKYMLFPFLATRGMVKLDCLRSSTVRKGGKRGLQLLFWENKSSQSWSRLLVLIAVSQGGTFN
jgi:hypothetical protein